MKLKPVIPFEPIAGRGSFPQGDNWVAQIKWDGVRMLTYFDGEQIRLWNRRRNEKTVQYPEFTDITSYCRASSVILDGEMIALEAGKPSFHELMRRDRMRDSARIKQSVARIPVTYMVFDVLYCDGKWVIDHPLSERQRMLEQILIPRGNVQPVQNTSDAAALYEVMKTYGMEGIVCKDLTKAYALDGKDERWQKFKLFQDVYAVVGGVTFRGKTVNALLLGLYNNSGSLVYIGHAGTGKVTQQEWAHITQLTESMQMTERPFVNEPERSKDAFWIRPEIVVRVQFLNWTPDGVMRHPSIQSFVWQQNANARALCTIQQLTSKEEEQ